MILRAADVVAWQVVGELLAGEGALRHAAAQDCASDLELHGVVRPVSETLAGVVRLSGELYVAATGVLGPVAGREVAKFPRLRRPLAVDVVHPGEVGRAAEFLGRLHCGAGLVPCRRKAIGDPRHRPAVDGGDQRVEPVNLGLRETAEALADAREERGGVDWRRWRGGGAAVARGNPNASAKASPARTCSGVKERPGRKRAHGCE